MDWVKNRPFHKHVLEKPLRKKALRSNFSHMRVNIPSSFPSYGFMFFHLTLTRRKPSDACVCCVSTNVAHAPIFFYIDSKWEHPAPVKCSHMCPLKTTFDINECPLRIDLTSSLHMWDYFCQWLLSVGVGNHYTLIIKIKKITKFEYFPFLKKKNYFNIIFIILFYRNCCL